jgi:hypothetical protein
MLASCAHPEEYYWVHPEKYYWVHGGLTQEQIEQDHFLCASSGVEKSPRLPNFYMFPINQMSYQICMMRADYRTLTKAELEGKPVGFTVDLFLTRAQGARTFCKSIRSTEIDIASCTRWMSMPQLARVFSEAFPISEDAIKHSPFRVCITPQEDPTRAVLSSKGCDSTVP